MHGGEKRGKEMSIIFGNIIFFPYLCSIYTNHMINIRKLETELWESADLLRQGSKLTSSQYCMPVLALLFLRYAYGLCKIATIQEIEEKNYSLTPGAYVGVAEQEDDGVDFHERMNEIHAELAQLNQEAGVLMDEIQKAWEELKEK